MQLSKLVLAASLAAVGLVGFGRVAEAAPISSAAVIECANADTSGFSVPLAAGANEVVTAQAVCVTPVCVDGVLTVVTDDSGVQHQACVASAADPAPTPDRSTLSSPAQSAPATHAPAVLPATGAGTGGLVIAALLVGSGSAVSLISRRGSAGARKGFRRRGVTP